MMMSQPKTTLMVVRHGETVWNLEQRFQGHGDSPLTEQGRSEVRALGKRLKTYAFDHLISSDLGRAVETATLIAENTGHKIITDPRLRERHYGVLEGLTIKQIQVRHAKTFSSIIAGHPDEVIPGGESHRQLYERNIDFVQQFLSQNAGATALLVVHGGVLDSFVRFITQLPLDHPRCYTAVNASLNIFSHGRYFHSHRWVMNTWGDTSHLDA
jgi:probable phosphoglycerate mutase